MWPSTREDASRPRGPTTHSDPSYLVDGVVHYCVTNMPAAVPNTSTLALTNATFPYLMKLAKLGANAAIREDAGIAEGVNTFHGMLTCKPVAESQQRDWQPVGRPGLAEPRPIPPIIVSPRGGPVPMGRSASRRKIVSIALGSILVVLLGCLRRAERLHLKFLNPATTGEIVVFTGLSALAFLLFVTVLVLLVRNVLKLYADQRSRVMGTRLRTRMLWGAVLVSLVPIVFMFLFSYGLMNRAVDRWFSQPVTEMRDDSNRMALQLAQYTSANARAEAESIAVSLAVIGEHLAGSQGATRARRTWTPSTASCTSTRSPCRTASPSSTAKAAPSPPSTCRRPPALPRRSSPGCRTPRPSEEDSEPRPTPAATSPATIGPDRRPYRRGHPRRGAAQRPAHLLARRQRLRPRHRRHEAGRHRGRRPAHALRHRGHHDPAAQRRRRSTGASTAAAARYAISTCCSC